MSKDKNRADAELEYSLIAHDYVKNPVGSRDWCIFWEGWCSRGKRAAVGSAEPVARLLSWAGPKHIPVPHGGIAARTYAEFSEEAANKPDSYWKNSTPLFTAPPAPVSAEPVKWDDSRADEIVSGLYRKFKEWNKRGFGSDDVTWCEVKAEINRLISMRPSAPPSTDAKDSERLAEAIKRMDRARKILTNGNPTPDCNWGMLDTSDLVKP